MQTKMTFEQTLDAIHSYLRFGSKLGLERMAALLEKLGNPQDQLPVIHVAGTNGKGSVCRYLCAVLAENGYRVGLYSSPYLERFTERIVFDGEEISPDELVEYGALVMAAAEAVTAEQGESPTEFELVTAIAFLYFSRQPVDFVVLEVGLGGIGDSTNVIKQPLVSVITSISFDHMNYLGDTLGEIAANKAGIIKPGVPVVFAVKEEEAQQVICQTAQEQNAPVIDVSKAALQVQIHQETLGGSCFSADIMGKPYKALQIGMAGRHQVENAVVALAVIETLANGNHITINNQSLYEGMRKTIHPGRLEKISDQPLILIDGAHNEAGVASLCQTIQAHLAGQKLLFIIGMLADKEVGKMIRTFGETGASLMATEPDNPRKLSSKALAETIREAGFDCVDGGDWEQATAYALTQGEQWDCIIFAGSLYLIGKVRGGLQRGIRKAEKEETGDGDGR